MLSIAAPDDSVAAFINTVVDGYGPAFRAWLDADNTRIVVLAKSQRYNDASRGLRRCGIDVDAWPVPPGGLFVVEEATVYLRSVSEMTIAHEIVHAYDRARGRGIYLSGYEPTVRRLFAKAPSFITPYAASGLDEYFAECGRALHPGGNDPRSRWPPATAERLEAIDPEMHAYLQQLLREMPPSDVAIAA
jgi:hypothetical protein